MLGGVTSPAELLNAAPLTFWLLIDALAVYRLTRLITRDTLPPIVRVRDYVLERWRDRALTELAVCPWCISFWLAVGVLAARMVAPAPWSLVSLTLAWSAIAGLLSTRD